MRPELPELVRKKLAASGPSGERWLVELPALLADLARIWHLRIGQVLHGGSTSVVLLVTRADGTAAVLKIAPPQHSLAAEMVTLERAEGRGYAKLLAADSLREAILLERLGPSLERLDPSPEEQVDLLCRTLRTAWQIEPQESHNAGSEPPKAAALGNLGLEIWERLGRPCPQVVIEKALRCAENRSAASDTESAVVVHGDPHPGNLLQSAGTRVGAETGYVFVDPDGFIEQPAYDLGVVLRDWTPQLRSDPGLLRRLCIQMSNHTGIDPIAIWEWGLLERVTTGLYMLDFGAVEHGTALLESARVIPDRF